MEYGTFAAIEAQSEAPFLPRNMVAGLEVLRDGETRTLRLHNVQRLEIFTKLLILGSVFIWWRYFDFLALE
jgi:hypothetical protein